MAEGQGTGSGETVAISEESSIHLRSCHTWARQLIIRPTGDFELPATIPFHSHPPGRRHSFEPALLKN
jgi:hypothetical protein